MSKDAQGSDGTDNDTVAGARLRVEEARERLGDSVGQLAAKTDVKGRTQDKAAEVRDQVVEAGHQVRDQVKERTPERVREVAAKAAATGKDAATKAAETGRKHPRPLLVAGGVAGVALVAFRARKRARKH